MRLWLTACMCAAILGGVALFLHPVASKTTADGPGVAALAVAKITLELTPTFRAAPDAFGLDLSDATKSAALLVEFGGKTLLRRDAVEPGETITVEVDKLPPGRHEFLLEAHPAGDDLARSQALRLRVLRDGAPVDDHTFWTTPGAPLQTVHTVTLAAPADGPQKAGQHDHDH